MIAVKPETETVHIDIDKCPLNSENPPINAVTLAAMREAEDMISGKIQTAWYKTPEDMINALKEEINR